MRASVTRALAGLAIAIVHLAETPAEARRNDAVTLKMVRYRDAISFPIPVTWKEEDEPGIQGTFYEDAPDTGTLRVSVMQWLGSSEEDRNRIVESILLPGDVEALKQ